MPDRIQPTAEIAGGLYILNLGFVASYVFDAGDSLLAFDSGMNPEKVGVEMGKLGLDPAGVKVVFLTHSDPDHVGGVSAFPRAKPYFSEAEVAMWDHSTARFFGMVFAKPPRFAYGTVEDGLEMRIGDTTVKCISTPGHTSGSMSFLIDGKDLIVGDELNLRHGKAVLDRKLICVDDAKRHESIRKLAMLQGVKTVCTAHSGYSEDFRAAMAQWETA